MARHELGVEWFSLLVAALLTCGTASCAEPPVAPERATPRHPEARPILADPPASCAVTADSLEIDDDWLGTGIEVEELTPTGWDPQLHPTLIFLHGDNTAPGQYHCYRELLASCCVRSIYPRQPNTARCEMKPLGWDQRFIRWSNLTTVYHKVVEQQDADRVIIGGHSIGAYTAMLAAGARSVIRRQQAGNCSRRRCRPLRAAGYVSVSGWPARSSRARRPFWFPKRAFDELRPNRYVAYGTLDNSSTDGCLRKSPPTCRGDAFEVDRERADELNLRLDVIEGFEHVHFMCNDDWRTSHEYPHQIRDFVERLGDWITVTAATDRAD